MAQSNEYRAARRVLLDALQALEGQLPSLILVGAQAIYLRVGDVDAGLATAPTTTDGDLVLNVDLLARRPDLSDALARGGFATTEQPGTWRSPEGISVDLMVSPHQSGRTSPSARAARLAEHGHPGKRTARIAAGLEPALVDHDVITLTAFDSGDDRSTDLNVAGPSALIAAKLIKLQERLDAADNGQPNRVRGKDVTDIFRILVGTQAETLRLGFIKHREDPSATVVTDRAYEFLSADLAAPARSRLRTVFANETDHNPVQLAQWDALVGDLMSVMAG